MEIKGIKKLNESTQKYILKKTRTVKKPSYVTQTEIEENEMGYTITENDLTDFAKMQSAEGIKKAIDGLGKFLEEPELEMQR